MNINKVYIANIYVLIESRLIGNLYDGRFNMKIMYLKTALVYNKNGNWYDLNTREKYYEEVYGLEKIGTKFINFKDKIIPLTNIIDYKNEHMSRRKILKKYKEVENGGKKE